MATSIFELFGTIMVDNTKADESITKTEKKAGSLAEKFASGTKKVAAFGASCVALGTAAVTGVTKLAGETAEALDVVDKASQRMQLSTDSYQELAHVTNLCGVEMSTLEKAAKKLDDGVTLDQALDEIYALNTAEERAAKAAELFGDSVAYQLTPMLNETGDSMAAMRREAHDLGLVVSEDAVKSGANLNDTLYKLKASLGGMVTQLGASLMPIVQKFADMLLKYMPKVQEIFDRIAPVLIDLFDTLMPPLMDLADAIFPVIFDLLEAVLPIIAQVAETVLPIITDLISKIAPIITKIAEKVLPVISSLLEAILPIIDAIWPIISQILDLVLGLLDPILNLIDVLLPPLVKIIESLSPIIETIGKLLEPIINLISAVLNPALKILEPLLTPITAALQILNPLLEVLNGILKPILDLINLILTPITDFVNFLFGDITEGVGDVSDSLGEGGLLGSLGSVSGFLFGDFSEAFSTFGSIMGEATSLIGDAFHGIINFLNDPRQAISDFVDWAGGKLNAIKTTFSGIADLIEEKERKAESDKMTPYLAEVKKRAYAGTLDTTNKEQMNAIRREYGLPELAGGAVLEPNRPFLAVVGDQSHGVNVEAPLDTIKQAVREELDQIVVNVLFNVENDTDRMYEIIKDKSWTERKRTSANQFG